MGQTANVGVVEYATVKSADSSNNLVSVVLNTGSTHDTQYNAIIFGGAKIPAADTQGLVLIIGGDKQHMFWLGAIQDVAKESHKQKIEGKPGEVFFANDKNTAFLKVSEEIISLANISSSFLATKNSLNIACGNNHFDLTDSQLSIQTKKSKFKLADTESLIETEAPIKLVSGSDIQIVCKNNFIVSGGLYNSEETDFFKKFGGVNKFLLKAVESKVSIGSMMVLDAGALTVNVCSGMFVGGATPGSGSLTTFKLNVAQGDLIAATGGGDIEINCLTEINSLSLYAGRKPASALYSEVELKATSLKIKNFSPLTSSIEFARGTITATTDMDIKMQPTQRFIVEATMDIDMSTKTKATIDAKTDLDLKGQATIKTTTPQLNLEDAKIIKAGPKTVVPTGTGPFCSVQFCPILGIAHAGEMCNG